MVLANRLMRAAAAPLFLAWSLIASCDREKGLLESVRKGEMEIAFARNRAKNEAVVRNNIPVEIKVILHSEKFGDQEVTDRIQWEYLDKTLGEVVYDTSLQAYAYLQNGIKTGRQKITAKLEIYAAAREFDISPVELVSIPGGPFMMGSVSSDKPMEEQPAHEVRLDQFAIGKYEVTNLEYRVYLEAAAKAAQVKTDAASTPAGFYSNDGRNKLYLATKDSEIQFRANGAIFINTGFEDHPVTGVTWEGANAFARYYGMALPTEAQWEYACKGATTTDYFWGNEVSRLPDYAVFKPAEGDTALQPVGGTRQHNVFKLFDVYGNAREWCEDWYSDSTYYRNPPIVDPRGPASSKTYEKVLRGGGFTDVPMDCRSARRFHAVIDSSKSTDRAWGFRAARPN